MTCFEDKKKLRREQYIHRPPHHPQQLTPGIFHPNPTMQKPTLTEGKKKEETKRENSFDQREKEEGLCQKPKIELQQKRKTNAAVRQNGKNCNHKHPKRQEEKAPRYLACKRPPPHRKEKKVNL